MDELHHMQLNHLDLKSQNVLLTTTSGVSATAKITAFGCHATAQLLDEDILDICLGTPEWMAPELLDGPKNITRHADVYSFAMVLYELLTVRLTNFLMSDREPLLSAQRRCFLQMDRPYYGYPGWRTIEQGHLGVDLIPIWASQDDQRPAIHPTCPAEWEGLMTECWRKCPMVRNFI